MACTESGESGPRRLLLALVWLPALAIVSTSVHALVVHHVSVPVEDQLVIYPSLLRDPLPEAVLAARNGHRIVVPALLAAADIHAFGASNRLLVAAVLVSLAGLALLVARGGARPVAPAAVALALALLFWFGQHRLLGVPFNGAIVYVTAALSAAALALFDAAGGARRPPVRRLALGACLATAVLASLSFGVGMAVWPALGLLWHRQRGSRRVALLLLGGAAVSLALFFSLPGGDTAVRSLAVEPRASARFLLSFLGGPVVHALAAWPWMPPELARLAGHAAALAGLAALGWTVARQLGQGRVAPAPGLGAALAVFALGAAGLIALGRSAAPELLFGAGLLPPRFLVWPVLFWIGLCLLRGGPRRSAVVLVLALLCWTLLPSHQRGLARARRHQEATRIHALALQLGVPHRRAVLGLADARTPEHRRVRGLLTLTPLMRSRQLGIFRDGRHALLGRQAPFPAETLPACRGRLGTLEAVPRAALLGGNAVARAAPLGEHAAPEGETIAYRVRGRVAADVPRDATLLLLDADGNVAGLGTVERPSAPWLGSGSGRRLHGTVVARLAPAGILAVVATGDPPTGVCRLASGGGPPTRGAAGRAGRPAPATVPSRPDALPRGGSEAAAGSTGRP